MWTNTKRAGCTAVVALGVLAASDAAAQSPDPDAPPTTSPAEPAPPPSSEPIIVEPAPQETNIYVEPPPPAPVVVETEAERTWFERAGISVAAGGGVAGFTSDEMRDATNDGGMWDVRVTLGSRSPLAFEGSYIGSVQEISALGLDNDALLMGNGAQGALRFNFTQDYAVQPFVYGGVAWMRYDLTNEDFNTSDISSSDDVLEIPVGAGIGLRSSGFLVDVRGEFRGATEEDLMPTFETGEGEDAAMHRYAVKATLGYDF